MATALRSFELNATGWRLVVRRQLHATGDDSDHLHVALRELALGDRAPAPDAFAVVMTARAHGREHTELHGKDALTLEDWIERVETGSGPSST